MTYCTPLIPDFGLTDEFWNEISNYLPGEEHEGH